MSKELEEIKSIVAIHFGALGFLNPSENEQILKDRDKVLNYLSRFESIDNAKPSEALKNITLLASELGTSKDIKFTETRFPKMLITIKQALIKAQEQEKVLEIIKEKKVIVDLLIGNNLERYNYEIIKFYGNYGWTKKCFLTQEEFELLKRWLG